MARRKDGKNFKAHHTVVHAKKEYIALRPMEFPLA